MTEFQSVDDFLNYKPQESGGGSKRLKSWAKDKGYLNWWFHRKQFPCAVWYHRIPELVVRKDKDDPAKELRNVWSRQHACWEDESILKKQRFRTADGFREHPPKRCGACRLPEAVREMIIRGTLKDSDLLFRFDGADKPEENRVIHAGGACSIWKRDIDDATKQRLAQFGIYFGNAPGRPGVWSESFLAKLHYVFVGVDNDDVGSGLQVAVQTQLVGDKVKRAINDEIASKDGDKGNPFVNPYCIQCVYKPEEKKFDDKYHARRIDRFPLSPQIEELISGEKPDISKYVSKFNQKELRAKLEVRALVDLPWDSIFDVPEPGNPDAAPPVNVPGPRTTAQVPANVGAAAAPAAPPPADAGPNLIPCDDCKALMREDETKCQKCGAVYAIDPGPAPAAAPPPPAAPAASPPTAAAAPATDPTANAVYDQGDDDVPF